MPVVVTVPASGLTRCPSTIASHRPHMFTVVQVNSDCGPSMYTWSICCIFSRFIETFLLRWSCRWQPLVSVIMLTMTVDLIFIYIRQHLASVRSQIIAMSMYQQLKCTVYSTKRASLRHQGEVFHTLHQAHLPNGVQEYEDTI